jgi:hypothetical protein
MNPDAYIREIESINDALKRLNTHAKTLREKKKVTTNHLYSWMKNHDIDEYNGIKIEKIKPKEKKFRKKEKDKKEDAIRLFTEIGIPDPEGFWSEFRETQKGINQNESQIQGREEDQNEF